MARCPPPGYAHAHVAQGHQIIWRRGCSKKIQPKKTDQKNPKKSAENLTYPAGFFWILLKNVSFINILVLFSLFTIIEPKILMY